jgi:hypothetical protein
MIAPDELALFHFVDSPSDAFSLLQQTIEPSGDTAKPAFAKSVTPRKSHSQSRRSR